MLILWEEEEEHSFENFGCNVTSDYDIYNEWLLNPVRTIMMTEQELKQKQEMLEANEEKEDEEEENHQCNL